MKKNLLVSFATTIVVMTLISGAHAQQANNSLAFTQSLLKDKNAFSENFEATNSPSNSVAEVNSKALTDFSKSFKLAQDVKWYKMDNGFLAYFTEKGVKSRTVYNAKGNRLYSMRSYPVDYLSLDVKDLVKNEYPNYSIFWVNEITMNHQLIYVVRIENKYEWKNILVRDGEIGIMEEFDK